MESWKFDQDPHKVIPTGYHSFKNKYTVVGFSAPAGEEVRHLMVIIRYDGGGGDSTTIKYLSVLYDYFGSLSFSEFVRRHI